METGSSAINSQEQESQKPMQVLFFDPPYHTDQELAYSLLKDNDQNMDLPRGMLSVASYLEANQTNSRVVSLDAYLNPKKAEFESGSNQQKYEQEMLTIVDQQIKNANPNIIGVSLMYAFAEPVVLKITQHLKQKYPDKKVVVGGNHATFSDAELLKPENGIDAVVRFEGEETMLELVQEIQKDDPDLSKVKGISYLDPGGKLKQNPPRDRMDLYKLPPLDYSLIKTPNGLDRFNSTAMFLRGCMGNCAFCTSPGFWNRELTQADVDNFETEVKYLAEQGIKTIGIFDDDILASEEAFEIITKVLQKYHELYPDVEFLAETRVSHLRDEKKAKKYLEKMKQAGISLLYLGIESGSQKILNEMAKGYKTKWVEPALKNIKKAGIKTAGFWIFGHPGATKKEEDKSLGFLEDLVSKGLLDELEAHCAVPFPGTRLAKDSRIRVFDTNKKHYGFLNNYPVYDLIDPQTQEVILSAAEINSYLQKAIEIGKKYKIKTI